mgnify:FL=1|tara:strand:+ start:187 stop:348 length:162 start_codon:yes stop_codon:yes gene_type:complete
MKILLLIFFVIAVLIIFNFINKSKLRSKKNTNEKNKTIDLEKDPKTNVYKPKE